MALPPPTPPLPSAEGERMRRDATIEIFARSVASHSEATTSDLREVVMAWPERTGIHSWRVRYRRGVGTESISGFSSEDAARSYISDMDTDRRRGTWIDPADGNTTLVTWVEHWFPRSRSGPAHAGELPQLPSLSIFCPASAAPRSAVVLPGC